MTRFTIPAELKYPRLVQRWSSPWVAMVAGYWVRQNPLRVKKWIWWISSNLRSFGAPPDSQLFPGREWVSLLVYIRFITTFLGWWSIICTLCFYLQLDYALNLRRTHLLRLNFLPVILLVVPAWMWPCSNSVPKGIRAQTSQTNIITHSTCDIICDIYIHTCTCVYMHVNCICITHMLYTYIIICVYTISYQHIVRTHVNLYSCAKDPWDFQGRCRLWTS
jgi:hypothetical protein